MFNFPYFDLSKVFSWGFISHGWDKFVLAWAWIWETAIWATIWLWNAFIFLSEGVIGLSGKGLSAMWAPEAGFFAIPALGQITAFILSIVLFSLVITALTFLSIMLIGLVFIVWILAVCGATLWLVAWIVWYACRIIAMWILAPFWNLLVWIAIAFGTVLVVLTFLVIIFAVPAAIVARIIRWLSDQSDFGVFLSIICWGAYALLLHQYTTPLGVAVYFVLAAMFYLENPKSRY